MEFKKDRKTVKMKINISKGRYWDEGITLIDGCTPCSPGCDHCWALSMQKRFSGENKTIGKGIWLHPERLKRFNTRKPKVFAIWNDLFHEAVPTTFIDMVLESIIKAPQHSFLELTKRPQRQYEYWDSISEKHLPRNIWYGLTICNQQEADEKIPIFLQVPGKKFLSIEPALGHININKSDLEKLDLVIYGAETGAGARPIELNWARSMMVDCQIANVPFFLKQLDKKHNRLLDGKTYDSLPWVTP